MTVRYDCFNYVRLIRFTSINTLRPRQNGRHFADDTFNRIFVNENVRISIEFSLKFPKGPINNIPALVQIMAWRRPGDKPLSEPMLVRSLTHICVTRPEWVWFWLHRNSVSRVSFLQTNYNIEVQWFYSLLQVGHPKTIRWMPWLMMLWRHEYQAICHWQWNKYRMFN